MKWRSGRLWLHILVYGIGGLIALFLLTQAVLLWQFDERAVRRTLEASLSDTGRRVTVTGDISPRLFPRPGLKVEQLSVTGPDGSSPFLSVGELRLGFAWLPLLLGDKEVTAISLERAHLNLARDAGGRLSIADLLRRRASSSVSVKLDALSLRDAQIAYADALSGHRWRLDSLDLDADKLRDNASLSAGALFSNGHQQVSLAINTPLLIQDDQVTVSDLDLLAKGTLPEQGETRVTLQGRLKLNFAALQASGEALKARLTTEKPQAELTLDMPTINASLTEIELPRADLQGYMRQDRSEYRFDGRLDEVVFAETRLAASRIAGALTWHTGAHQLSLQVNGPLEVGNLDVLKVEPLTLTASAATPLLPRGKLVAQLAGTLEGSLASSELTLRVAGKLDGSDLAADLRQFGFVKPRHELMLSVGKLDLNRYLPENSARPVAVFQDKRPLSLDWLDFLNVSGQLSVGELAVGRFKINGVSAKVDATPQELAVNELSANIYEGQLTGSASLVRGSPHRLDVNQTLKGMSIRPLLTDLFNFPRLDGHGDGRIKVRAQGSNFAAFKDTLSGDVEMSLNQGALTGIDLVAALKNLPQELKDLGSTPVNAENDQRTTFSTLSARFALENGVARNQNLKLASQLVNVSGGGKLDLVKSIVDYSLDVSANPREFARLKDVNVPLKITGPINAPVYALDFNAMVKGKKTQGEKEQALKQELKKQITTILP
ncbi:AsmA family protein [Crenobacter cavernae]|uniref:AsmA family protein n=1 Tax=Crenobacter cavernae TaxID=2290923 RepID=A0ABY0FGX0_9NEIS|nr:AsmA family protein [Crenobacter cavernae]RXZ45631.1 AsmA family protein [Crenobacter cavernae]